MNSKSSLRLSRDEKQIDKDLSAGRFRSLGPKTRETYARIAQDDRAHRKNERKDQRINIRLTSRQLQQLRDRADREGLPYQSLVASIIEKFLNGSLVDAANLAAIKRILKAI